MRTRPKDLDDSDIVTTIREGWGLTVSAIEHAAVGYGSHHWIAWDGAIRWFVTVDDLESRTRHEGDTFSASCRRLAAALNAARKLHDLGLEFVVAPIKSLAGHVTHRFADRFVAALYSYVEGKTFMWGPFERRADRLAVLDRIAEIHSAAQKVGEIGLTDDFVIPRRDQLATACADLSGVWEAGPYAESARALLRGSVDELQIALDRYDSLVGMVSDRSDRFVLTHGEPHRANTITTPGGVMLIDWDTALLAPPERDLWALIDEDERIPEDYTSRTGVVIDWDAVTLYRLWWDLCEISLCVSQFRQPHQHDEDTRVAWATLQLHLDPSRWVQIL